MTTIKNMKDEIIFSTTSFNEDPLVLSCFLHRDENNKFKSIHNLDLIKDLTPADFEQANKIIDYYSKKLMMIKLLGIPLTQFKQDLSSILYSDRKELTNDKIGIIHRLPVFYEYDIAFDEFKTNFVSLANTQRHYFNKHLNNDNLNFKKYFFTGKSSNPHEYWFSDKNNELFLLAVSKTNEIKTALDFIIRKNEQLTVKCNAKFYSKDEFGFWKIINWEIS